MIERSYWHDRELDAAMWADLDGPWRSEPDKKQWIDEATGLPCLLLRSDLGFLCGYVGVGPGHPAHMVGWRCAEHETPLPFRSAMVDYSAVCQVGVEEEYGICHATEPGDETDVWWFGFACNHLDDVVPLIAAASARHGMDYPGGGGFTSGAMVEQASAPTYKTIEYVQATCARLAAELTEWQRAGVLPSRSDDLLDTLIGHLLGRRTFKPEAFDEGGA